jgi:hypothetical protein
MKRERALALFLDAGLIAAAVDVPAALILLALFFFAPEAPLTEAGLFAFIVSLCAFLARDARGGLSRKWLGFKIEDEGGRPPGWLRSAVRNLPLFIPGWNVYEALRVFRAGGSPRSLDRLLKLHFEPIP